MNAAPSNPQTLICPACGKQQLKAHCPSEATSCHWLHCTSRACDAVLDLVRRRGHRAKRDLSGLSVGRESFTFHALDGSGRLGPP